MAKKKNGNGNGHKTRERHDYGERIEAHLFVKIWQTSETFAEVQEQCGGRPRALLGARATRLRNAGVPLKTFPRGRSTVDIAALAKIAKEHAPKN